MHRDAPRRFSMPLLRRLERSLTTLLATRWQARTAGPEELARASRLLSTQATRAHLPLQSVHLPAPALESRGRRRVQVARRARGTVSDASRVALSPEAIGSSQGGGHHEAHAAATASGAASLPRSVAWGARTDFSVDARGAAHALSTGDGTRQGPLILPALHVVVTPPVRYRLTTAARRSHSRIQRTSRPRSPEIGNRGDYARNAAPNRFHLSKESRHLSVTRVTRHQQHVCE